jgi:hypothetical protein
MTLKATSTRGLVLGRSRVGPTCRQELHPRGGIRLLALIVAVAVLVVSAAGCGGTATATPSTTATVAGASPPPKLSKQRQARKRALTKLARCMRAHGASFPDPTPDGRIAGGMATVSAAINGPNGQQALSACWSYVLAVQETLGGAYGP